MTWYPFLCKSSAKTTYGSTSPHDPIAVTAIVFLLCSIVQLAYVVLYQSRFNNKSSHLTSPFLFCARKIERKVNIRTQLSFWPYTIGRDISDERSIFILKNIRWKVAVVKHSDMYRQDPVFVWISRLQTCTRVNYRSAAIYYLTFVQIALHA